ncbi:hypothetical protein HDU88_005717 [Geranomyces variabilis]|nr:hypothetical protein HDU88_005717 [Geranomyces variabilis]
MDCRQTMVHDEDEDQDEDEDKELAGYETVVPGTLPGRVYGLAAAECIVQVVVLGWGMVARTRTGVVFAWGRIAEWSTSQFPPRRLAGDHLRARQISGGRDFCILLSNDHKVYWTQDANEEPQRAITDGLTVGETVVHVAGGWTHGLALTSRGRILQWKSAADDIPTFIEAPGEGMEASWSGVAGGEGFTVAITRAGNVYTWTTAKKPLLKKVTEVSGGYTHVSAAFRSYALFSPPFNKPYSASSSPPTPSDRRYEYIRQPTRLSATSRFPIVQATTIALIKWSLVTGTPSRFPIVQATTIASFK